MRSEKRCSIVAHTILLMDSSDLGQRLNALEERVRMLERSAAGPLLTPAPRSAPAPLRDQDLARPRVQKSGIGSVLGCIILSVIAVGFFIGGLSSLFDGDFSGVVLLILAALTGWAAHHVLQGNSAPQRIQEHHPETEIQASVLLGRVGIGIVLIGLVFLFRVAVDQGLLGPGARVGIGLLTGGVALIIGQYSREKYRVWAQMFTGGGLALLYFTFYVAHTPEYALIGDTLAFTLMLGITALAWYLAARNASAVIAVFAFVGGYVTPLLARSVTPNYVLLLLYVLILTLGVLALASRAEWRPLQKASFFFTSAYLIGTIDSLPFKTATAFVLAFFVLFNLIPVARSLRLREVPGRFDALLIVLNALFTYGALQSILAAPLGRNFGFVALGVALFFVVLAAFANTTSLHPLRALYATIAVAYLAAAAFVGFSASTHIPTALWAILAFALLCYGFAMQLLPARAAALVLLGMSIIRLLAVDSGVRLDTYTPVLNGRVATYLLVIIVIGAAGWIYRRENQLGVTERADIAAALPVIAHVLVLIVLTLEINDAFARAGNPDNVKHVVLSVTYALYGLGLLAVGIARRMRAMRIAALIILTCTVIKVAAVDASELAAFARVSVYVLVGVLLILASYSYQRYKWLIVGERDKLD